jgi:hypothetical protein
MITTADRAIHEACARRLGPSWSAANQGPTDTDLAEVFGPDWVAVTDFIRSVGTLTADEIQALEGTYVDAYNAAYNATSFDAAVAADASNAASDAYNYAFAYSEARKATRRTALALAARHTISPEGPFTQVDYETLTGQWRGIRPGFDEETV